jgi:hypothetical protein
MICLQKIPLHTSWKPGIEGIGKSIRVQEQLRNITRLAFLCILETLGSLKSHTMNYISVRAAVEYNDGDTEAET